MKEFLITIGAIIIGIFLFAFITGKGFGPGKDQSVQGQIERIGSEAIVNISEIQP